MTHDPVLLALDALACFRLTRLLVLDAISAPLREALVGRRLSSARTMSGHKLPVARRPRVAGWLACPWCVSVWAAGLVLLAQALAPAAWLYASALLAFSALAGILSEAL